MLGSGVAREVVLKALRAAGPPHTRFKLVIADSDSMLTAISREDGQMLAVEFLPALVSMRTVNRLCRRLHLPKLWFSEPLSIPGSEEQRKPC